MKTSLPFSMVLRAGFVATLAAMAFTELGSSAADDYAIALHSEWDPTEQEDNYSLYHYH